MHMSSLAALLACVNGFQMIFCDGWQSTEIKLDAWISLMLRLCFARRSEKDGVFFFWGVVVFEQMVGRGMKPDKRKKKKKSSPFLLSHFPLHFSSITQWRMEGKNRNGKQRETFYIAFGKMLPKLRHVDKWLCSGLGDCRQAIKTGVCVIVWKSKTQTSSCL